MKNYILLTSLSLLFLLSSCAKEQNSHVTEQVNEIISVHTELPKITGKDELSLSGQLEAVKSSNISTRIMGYVNRVHVEVGDHVKAGQLLVTIGQEDIEAKKAQAQAAYKEALAARDVAQKDYERFQDLHARGSATEKELENITLQYTSAKSRTEAARQMINEANASLDYVNVKAPFSGVITRRLLDEGGIASPGMPILTLEETDDFQVRFTVPESEVHKIKKGTTIQVYIKSIAKNISADVTEISPSSKYSGGQYAVKALLDKEDIQGLYAGMFVNVSLSVVKDSLAGQTLLVPASSVVSKDQLTGVYLTRGNKAFLRWVRTGKQYGKTVEILSGLDEHDQVIVNPSIALYNGVGIKIQ